MGQPPEASTRIYIYIYVCLLKKKKEEMFRFTLNVMNTCAATVVASLFFGQES